MAKNLPWNFAFRMLVNLPCTTWPAFHFWTVSRSASVAETRPLAVRIRARSAIAPSTRFPNHKLQRRTCANGDEPGECDDWGGHAASLPIELLSKKARIAHSALLICRN